MAIQLILEFERYIQTLSVERNEIIRQIELFDSLFREYYIILIKYNAWIWLKEFINNSDKQIILNIDNRKMIIKD